MSTIALSVRNILRQRRRSIVALLTIACGIASLILASGFIEWNLWFGRESTIHSQLGHIRVVKSGYSAAGTADPFAFLLPDNPRERIAIESVPHVVTLAPRLAFNGLISHGESTLSFIGEGVVPDRERLLSRSLRITEGQNLSSSDPKGILVGQGLGANLGVKVGDTVILLTNTPAGSVNAVEAKVAGFFATVTKAYDDAALRIPIITARQLMRVSGVHSYTLLLDDTENTDAVVQVLRKAFRNQPLEFIAWYQLADFYKKTVALFSSQVSVMRLIIAAIIVLSISNSMMMSVLERTGEIGTSMALGVRRRAILTQFLGEGTLLGIGGGGVGLLLGYTLARFISIVGISMPPPPGMAFGYTAEVLVSGRLALESFALAIATTVIATLYPAWRASRMVVVDALRHNR